MTLEEAVAQFTDEKRIAINRAGGKTIVVHFTADGSFALTVAKDGRDIDYTFDGIYPNLIKLKNHFIGWAFAQDIDPNGWIISPE